MGVVVAVVGAEEALGVVTDTMDLVMVSVLLLLPASCQHIQLWSLTSTLDTNSTLVIVYVVVLWRVEVFVFPTKSWVKKYSPIFTFWLHVMRSCSNCLSLRKLKILVSAEITKTKQSSDHLAYQKSFQSTLRLVHYYLVMIELVWVFKIHLKRSVETAKQLW